MPLALACRQLRRLGYVRATWDAAAVLARATVAASLLAGLLGPLATAIYAVIYSRYSRCHGSMVTSSPSRSPFESSRNSTRQSGIGGAARSSAAAWSRLSTRSRRLRPGPFG